MPTWLLTVPIVGTENYTVMAQTARGAKIILGRAMRDASVVDDPRISQWDTTDTSSIENPRRWEVEEYP